MFKKWKKDFQKDILYECLSKKLYLKIFKKKNLFSFGIENIFILYLNFLKVLNAKSNQTNEQQYF